MPKATAAVGYSGRPLPAKLGFKPGMTVAFIALPPDLDALAAAVGFAEVVRRKDWRGTLEARHFDLIHAFTARRAEIAAGLPSLQAALKPAGMLWVSWPKKASNVPSDVTEDAVRSEALKLDLVDVKVAAIDAVWSGLKLVIRKDRR
jgi:hypothetical protein